ncbi:hypothetical protein [Fulvivirga sedimenti]|uniref:Uncharacterized protein n=1 Tax=Fulvivirga sedimenti TaxID=2879465 RepID=A0A9X1KWF1_9BACT|nr:hypothetical protein [Fulvivirga sedimenti]MCA6074720.1 hypothetical protein [Fulvivirga sedimenti]MCA6075897.1 hypothetical protein [Fulvivirga sedimenti]MCA6077025.1 hypothetical protein [Fulvivirga sedimenti]
MKFRNLFTVTVIFICCFTVGMKSNLSKNFDRKRDLLLVQFDCKTDVDDLQSAAALVTLLNHPDYSDIQYHAVAGTYGIQDGLYVPPNSLFQLAFGDNWTDAHENVNAAVDEVMSVVIKTLDEKGDIWIADAGQSDFTAMLVRRLHSDLPGINTRKRIHVVQHSDWNEEVTSPEKLKFVKENADYHKIPDGNAVGNGTPGFRSPDYNKLMDILSDPGLRGIWQLAIDLSNQYNGKEGRYNNEAIAAGGLDFSDLSEVCWILGLQDIRDTEAFFEMFSN